MSDTIRPRGDVDPSEDPDPEPRGGDLPLSRGGLRVDPSEEGGGGIAVPPSEEDPSKKDEGKKDKDRDPNKGINPVQHSE
jgi:hypothetical protein